MQSVVPGGCQSMAREYVRLPIHGKGKKQKNNSEEDQIYLIPAKAYVSPRNIQKYIIVGENTHQLAVLKTNTKAPDLLKDKEVHGFQQQVASASPHEIKITYIIHDRINYSHTNTLGVLLLYIVLG